MAPVVQNAADVCLDVPFGHVSAILDYESGKIYFSSIYIHSSQLDINLSLFYLWVAFALLPGFLDLDATAEFLQHKLPRVVVDDENTVLLIGTFVPFEHRHGRCGALGEKIDA